VRFFGAIPALSKELSKVMQVPFSILPSTCLVPEDFDPDLTEPIHDIGILGGSRSEQGVILMPLILPALKSRRPEVRILFQCQPGRQKKEFRSVLKKDGTDGMVSLITKTGTSTDYFRRIASCRLLLLPYLPEFYCLGGPGVFNDVSTVGRPIIASVQTSMGRMILSGIASGMVFRRMDPDRIAEAVCDGLDRIGGVEPGISGLVGATGSRPKSS